jgi:hypothetical protein
MASTATLQLPPLSKQRMTELFAGAKRMGIEPGDYAKRLIENGLAFQREAEESTFAEIMAPVRSAARDVDDAEVMKLVETARAAHHAGGRRKKR